MTKTTVLIVEDDAIVAADLARTLEQRGYEVLGIAATGEDAVVLTVHRRPDLVLMDISLEGSMDGITAAEAIRSQYDVPVVYLTAHSDAATLARAKLTGPVGYVLKPFDERDLATQIEMALYRFQADRQVREQREWLRVTLTSIGDAVVATDAEGRITFVNPVAEMLTGWTSEEAAGQPVESVCRLVNEQTGQPLPDPVAIVLRERRAVGLANHAALVTKDGRTVPIEDSAAPIRDDAGQVLGAVLVFHDVTEKRRVQEALRQAKDELEQRVQMRTADLRQAMNSLQTERQRFRDALDRLPAYLVLLSPDYSVRFANRFFEERFGASHGRRCFEYLFQRTEPCDNCESFKALQKRSPHRWEWTGPDGRTYDIYDFPFTDVDGSQLVMEVGLDITQRRQAEAELERHRHHLEEMIQERTSQLEAVMQTLPVGVAICNAEGGNIRSNPAFERIWGGPRPETRDFADYVCYKAWWAETGEPVKPDEWASALAVQKGETVVGQEMQIQRFDGTRAFIYNSAAPIRRADGHIVGSAVAIMDVTARAEAEERLKHAKQAAEAANAAKSQFLANMSHELRTPMNAILGMIDVALPKATDPIVQDCLQTARGSADLLLTLLNDLLDSAKIESGKLELESAPFSLRRMLDQITRVLGVRASEKGLRFYCRLPDAAPDAVIGDRMRLQQILLNLAGNAIKFTDHGDVEIDLRARSQEGEVDLEFAVRDAGIGIPPSGLELIFQPFAQADASMTRRFGGTGLGLSICKNLVEMMGGRIWVESQVGQGSTFHFTVRLPVAAELPADFDAPVAVPATPCAPLRILLVEDNLANQKLATYILQDRGHRVEIAGDGQEAICLTGQNRYDVILMDMQMPGMNGLETTAAIRRQQDAAADKGAGRFCLNGEEGMTHKSHDSSLSRRVPIIAMTALAMASDREQCLAAGMDGYLSKPINGNELIELVETSAAGSPSAAATPPSHEVSQAVTVAAFDPEVALRRCLGKPAVLAEVIQCFLTDAVSMLPQMRAALQQGDLKEAGRLAHQLKGTVDYLGAEPTREAALRVEQFNKMSGVSASDAEAAVDSLERECRTLTAALQEYALVNRLKSGDQAQASSP